MEFRARHYATHAPILLRLAGDHIASVDPAEPNDDLPLIAPGLIDLQINGYAGHDVNAQPLAPDTLPHLIRALWPQGVTACFPTVITNSVEAITQSLRTIAAACEADPATQSGVAGIHLEGPFISPHDGPRGAHAKQFVRPPDWGQLRAWQDASGGRIRIVTLSPEWPEAVDFIARAAASGVTVSIGHTAATSEQIADAVRAGARMSTHLGNAAHLMLPRHPNYLWEQLAQDDLWTCLIADGFHLPAQVLKVAMKVKGERAMIVSDAVSLAGLPPGEYASPVGGRVVVTPEGRLHLADEPRLLAGSAQMLLDGIRHLTKTGLASFAQAWDMASVIPARFMNLPSAAGLTPGAPADFVLLDPHSLTVRATVKSGQSHWKTPLPQA
jgi:N-acetylglucosamine-6-phosphate deacetylase